MSQSTLTEAQRHVDEQVSYLYTATLTDAAGDAIADGDLQTLILTLYEQKTGNIINSRDGQNVKNQNNVTVSNGVMTWKVQPADNAIAVAAKAGWEIHIALFEWTWNDSDSELQTGRHELTLRVRDLQKVGT